jgi:hypothetical protein
MRPRTRERILSSGKINGGNNVGNEPLENIKEMEKS